jgi:uncharacterized membrane protein YdjX (TVP38/TMEM64 family)
MARDERAWQRYRLVLLLLVVGGLWLTAWATGANRLFDVERLRTIVKAAGVWSGAVFVVAFSVGQLLRIPGPVFVGVAILAYGRTTGTLVAVLGAVVSVTVSFIVVRAIAGQPLANVQRPIVRRFLSQIDKHPIAVVAILRLVFQTAPPLNYALAMTQVRLRDHLIGSALGLPLPIAAMALVLDWLVHRAT